MNHFRTGAAARACLLLAGGVACPLPSAPAYAHVIAGARVFPVTLTFDDPGVSDEASLPAFGYSRSGADGGSGPTHEFDFGFEYDKTITPTTALILNDGYDVLQTNGAKTQAGFENLFVTGKWQFITDAAHEFVASVGISREIGGSGTDHIGADHYGSTAPVGYFGKGFGDLPIGLLRPFAVTGEVSYSIADKEVNTLAPAMVSAGSAANGGLAAQYSTAQYSNGNNNAWQAGFSVQYSIPYLQSQVRDLGLPPILGKLVPLVEVTWSSPASTPSTSATTWTVAPGAIYLAQWGEIGVEALIPANKAAGTNVGAAALVHIFLDDLLPHSLGKPLFQ